MVSNALSDLFFNSDTQEAIVMEDGKFKGYSEPVMLRLAQEFLDMVDQFVYEHISGYDWDYKPLPTPMELVNDFYGRL